MKEEYRRIWCACWIFGGILMGLSFLIALDPVNNYMVFVGIFFLVIHVLGLIKYNKTIQS